MAESTEAMGDAERREGIASNGKVFESVWDFLRPPAAEAVDWRIRVIHGGEVIADAPSAIRILETSQPPAYYVNPKFVNEALLLPSERTSYCEWKGVATYASVLSETGTVDDAAWQYLNPTAGFSSISGFWAFYAQRLDECYVDDERVAANPGMFYGGWLTANVTGPVKGAPGTRHW